MLRRAVVIAMLVGACRESGNNFPTPVGADVARVEVPPGADTGAADLGVTPDDAGAPTDIVAPDVTPQDVSDVPVSDAPTPMDAADGATPDVTEDRPAIDAPPPDLPTVDVFDAGAPDVPAPVDAGPVDRPAVDSGAGTPVGMGLSPDARPERRVVCRTDAIPAGSVTAGASDRYVLRGRVVTPSGVLSPGEVLLSGGNIACVAASCAGRTGYAGATVVETGGVIFPGLVNTHDHPQYDFLPPWPPPRLFNNSGQWQGVTEYRNFTQVLRDNEGMYTCEMVKWGELRSLVSGATTIQGAPQRNCVTRTLIRDIEYGNDFGGVDTHRPNTLGISTVDAMTAANLRRDMDSGMLTAYILHMSEGIDETARREFDLTLARNLVTPALVAIHATALGTPEWEIMGRNGAKVVWSPRSNIILYGRTTNVVAAMDHGVQVALAPDWSPSGGPGMLGELRYARYVSQEAFGGRITDRDLVEMVTSRAAAVVDRPQVGALVEGRYADVLVIPDTGCDAYSSLIDAPMADIRMVFVGGRPLYGDAALFAALPAAARERCEAVSFCGQSKTLCVALASTNDLLNQTYAQIEANLRSFTTPYPLVPVCP
ncbi:MAG: amidohydrolase family protein [Polyangiales bacterium]